MDLATDHPLPVRRFRPPAPKPLERPLGPLAFMAGLWRNPLSTWTIASFEKPIVISDSVMGRLAIVSDPASIRHVLVDNAANYRKDRLQLRVLTPGLGNGLLTAEGDDWRVQRRLIAPLFTPRRVATFLAAMSESAAWLMSRWESQRDHRRIDIAPEMSRVTLDVLERTIFPRGLGDTSAFGRAVTRYFETAGHIDPFDLLGVPDFVPRIMRARATPTLRYFRTTVERLIETRRRELAEGTGESEPSDLLALLIGAADPDTGIGLAPKELRATILTFIAAGHETTSNLLTWSLFLLAMHPDWRQAVEAEVDRNLSGAPLDSEGLDRFTVTRAVLDETLRLYPPAASLSREAIEADELLGRPIRQGSTVIISPWVLHRHRTLWEEPELFDPGRFLPGRREKIDRFAYLPFGAGPRVCIGAGFALQEALVILVNIIRRFRLELAPGHHVEPVQRITLRPKGGMPMLLQRRT